MERILCGLYATVRKHTATSLPPPSPSPVCRVQNPIAPSSLFDGNLHTFDNTPAFTLDGIQTTARVVDVYDADTMTVVMPFAGTYYRFSVRLAGIDSCEIKSKSLSLKMKALAARNRVLQLLGLNVALEAGLSRKEVRAMLESSVYTVWLVCGDFEKYGRVLGNVFQDTTSKKSLSAILLDEGHAYAYTGGTKMTEDQQESTM